MKPDIEIRKASPKDAPEIADVHVKSWQTAYKGIVPAKTLSSLLIDERTKIWTEIISCPPQGSQCTFVAVTNGLVVGFACAAVAREKVPFSYEIQSIYLRPKWFGKGIGPELFRACVSHAIALGHESMYVRVLAENTSGRLFYEKMGGQHVKGFDESRTYEGKDLIELLYGWSSLPL